MAYCERRSLRLVPAHRVWTVRVTIVGRFSFPVILSVDLGALRSGDTYIILGHCDGRRANQTRNRFGAGQNLSKLHKVA